MSKESDSNDAEDLDMADIADQPSFQPEQVDASMASRSVSSRGRKRIPEQWCRIVSMETDAWEDVVISSIKLDQQMPMLKAEDPPKRKNKEWKPLFSS